MALPAQCNSGGPQDLLPLLNPNENITAADVYAGMDWGAPLLPSWLDFSSYSIPVGGVHSDWLLSHSSHRPYSSSCSQFATCHLCLPFPTMCLLSAATCPPLVLLQRGML